MIKPHQCVDDANVMPPGTTCEDVCENDCPACFLINEGYVRKLELEDVAEIVTLPANPSTVDPEDLVSEPSPEPGRTNPEPDSNPESDSDPLITTSTASTSTPPLAFPSRQPDPNTVPNRLSSSPGSGPRLPAHGPRARFEKTSRSKKNKLKFTSKPDQL